MSLGTMSYNCYIQGSLVFTLHSLSSYHISEPLASFGHSLPAWGMGLGWALAALPLGPILCGASLYLLCADKGVPRLAVSITLHYYKDLPFFFQHLLQSMKPTERWHRNAKLELEDMEGYINNRNRENISTA